MVVWKQDQFRIELIGRTFTLYYKDYFRLKYLAAGQITDEVKQEAIKDLIDSEKRKVNKLTYQGEKFIDE
jgi:hypothetical protein